MKQSRFRKKEVVMTKRNRKSPHAFLVRLTDGAFALHEFHNGLEWILDRDLEEIEGAVVESRVREVKVKELPQGFVLLCDDVPELGLRSEEGADIYYDEDNDVVEIHDKF
jgi:hypothetical protein